MRESAKGLLEPVIKSASERIKASKLRNLAQAFDEFTQKLKSIDTPAPIRLSENSPILCVGALMQEFSGTLGERQYKNVDVVAA